MMRAVTKENEFKVPVDPSKVRLPKSLQLVKYKEVDYVHFGGFPQTPPRGEDVHHYFDKLVAAVNDGRYEIVLEENGRPRLNIL